MKRPHSLFWIIIIAFTLALFSFTGDDKAARVSHAGNDLGLRIYKNLVRGQGNLVFSPYSVSVTMGMLYGASTGDTAVQMEKALRLPLVREAYHDGASSLIERINGLCRKDSCPVLSVRRIWVDDTDSVQESYADLLRKYYGTDAARASFSTDPEKARSLINSWVSERTRDRIKGLIPREGVTKLTRSVVTNAVYFSGSWKTAFSEKLTVKENFYTGAQDRISVPMMHRAGHFFYYEAEDVQVLALPYRNPDLSLVVILPKKRGGIFALEKKLSSVMLNKWADRMGSREVNVALPRFRMAFDCRLSESLKKLGLGRLFSSKAGLIAAGKHFTLSEVYHKAFIDVNEKGTEAAAATGAVMVKANGGRRYDFRADHPFLFLIRDNKSGCILFLGRVANPGAGLD